jgi:hypothetical protein
MPRLKRGMTAVGEAAGSPTHSDVALVNARTDAGCSALARRAAPAARHGGMPEAQCSSAQNGVSAGFATGG